MLWNDQEKAELTKLWEGNSAAEIGDILHKSRNSVIGQARRLKLQPKAVVKHKGGIPKGSHRRSYQPKMRFRPRQVIRPPERPQKWAGSGVPLLEATSHQCKAVIGSTDGPNGLALFCGGPVHEKYRNTKNRYEFCDYHLYEYTVGR